MSASFDTIANPMGRPVELRYFHEAPVVQAALPSILTFLKTKGLPVTATVDIVEQSSLASITARRLDILCSAAKRAMTLFVSETVGRKAVCDEFKKLAESCKSKGLGEAEKTLRYYLGRITHTLAAYLPVKKPQEIVALLEKIEQYIVLENGRPVIVTVDNILFDSQQICVINIDVPQPALGEAQLRQYQQVWEYAHGLNHKDLPIWFLGLRHTEQACLLDLLKKHCKYKAQIPQVIQTIPCQLRGLPGTANSLRSFCFVAAYPHNKVLDTTDFELMYDNYRAAHVAPRDWLKRGFEPVAQAFALQNVQQFCAATKNQSPNSLFLTLVSPTALFKLVIPDNQLDKAKLLALEAASSACPQASEPVIDEPDYPGPGAGPQAANYTLNSRARAFTRKEYKGTTPVKKRATHLFHASPYVVEPSASAAMQSPVSAASAASSSPLTRGVEPSSTMPASCGIEDLLGPGPVVSPVSSIPPAPAHQTFNQAVFSAFNYFLDNASQRVFNIIRAALHTLNFPGSVLYTCVSGKDRAGLMQVIMTTLAIFYKLTGKCYEFEEPGLFIEIFQMVYRLGHAQRLAECNKPGAYGTKTVYRYLPPFMVQKDFEAFLEESDRQASWIDLKKIMKKIKFETPAWLGGGRASKSGLKAKSKQSAASGGLKSGYESALVDALRDVSTSLELPRALKSALAQKRLPIEYLETVACVAKWQLETPINEPACLMFYLICRSLTQVSKHHMLLQALTTFNQCCGDDWVLIGEEGSKQGAPTHYSPG